MRRIRWAWCTAAGLALAAAARPAAAQQPVPAPVTTPAGASRAAGTPATLGPTFAAAQFGMRQDVSAPTAVNPSAFKTSRREGRILALVGGAALITGLLIGDDAGTVIAVGGAAIGLYGLYIWQR
jgi:hypothetical protein